MKKILWGIVVFNFIAMTTYAAPKKSIKVHIELSPAGDFVIKGKPKGKLKIVSGKLSGTLTASCKKLRTGIDLRDEHLHKRLQCKKYPKISMKVTGSGGQGKGVIKVRDKKKQVSFTYSPLSGSYYKASFKLNLKDFQFSGIKYMGVGVQDSINVDVVMKVKK